MPDAVCAVCPRHCRLGEGQTGFCRARKNVGGTVVSLNYGLITSTALDPVEKKPLARYHSGKRVLSVGSFGCNMDCPFCQNYAIAGAGLGGVAARRVAPEALAETAARLTGEGNIGVAFTYNEPLVGFEYVRDAASEVKRRGLNTVMVTNGFASAETREALLPLIDAYNIDLKCFTEAGYRRLGGDFGAVKAFIGAAASRAHVELTALIVPSLNDSPKEMRDLAAWVASLDRSIPLHVTRFFPRRKMLDARPTDVALLRELAETAGEALDTVVLGNV